MSIDSSETQTDAFIRFLTHHRDDRFKTLSPEECVREFRTYQDELHRFLAESESAFEHARRDEGRELDVASIMKRVEQRIVDERSRQ